MLKNPETRKTLTLFIYWKSRKTTKHKIQPRFFFISISETEREREREREIEARSDRKRKMYRNVISL
jgi:hypothetical protein